MWKASFLMLFFFFFLLSLSVQKAILDCETMKKTKGFFLESFCFPEFPSPSLNSSTPAITMDQNVSLFCSHENKSLQITYSLFLHTKHLETKKGKGDPVIFNVIISTANDSGPYKCKAEVFNCSKYSPGFYFTMEGRSQEIHYAAPVFQEAAPREQEACRDCKTGYVYSELTF
ncbi:LOW QUALITY PROTEIN: allergin-1 [Erethizon dorsatum]